MGFLLDIIIILALSTAVNICFTRMRLPVVVGYLLTGLVAGQYGFEMLSAPKEIGHLAEVGIIFLLFTIGVELSIAKLLAIKRIIFLGGSMQVLFTIATIYVVASLFGFSVSQSLFFGFMVALSSTAVILKMLQETSELSSAHGRTTLGIAIFQDLVSIPMMLAIPLMASNESEWLEIALMAAKLLVLFVFLYLSHRYIVPRLLHEVAKTGNQEIFLFSIILIALSVAYITYILGLSLAFGAFLAGIIISETEYKHHAFSHISPFRDLFTSFFFVSIGMLLNVQFIFDNIGVVLASIGIVFFAKFLTGGAATFLLGFPLRVTILVGLALSQIGEFSFILMKLGTDHQLINSYYFNLFLAVAAATMAVSPLVIMVSPAITARIYRLRLPRILRDGFFFKRERRHLQYDNHTIIIGIGLHGYNLSKMFTAHGIPYIIIDIDAEAVRQEQRKGIPALYGDASQTNVLKHAGIEKAAVLVVAISNPVNSLRITQTARQLNPTATIVVKTRNVAEVPAQYRAGATKVVPEELETSINLLSSVLSNYLIPQNDIDLMLEELRKVSVRHADENHDSQPDTEIKRQLHLNIPTIKVVAVKVQDNCHAQGKTIGQLAFRSRHAVSIVGIQAETNFLINPPSSVLVCYNDIIYLMGDPVNIARLTPFFVDKDAVVLN